MISHPPKNRGLALPARAFTIVTVMAALAGEVLLVLRRREGSDADWDELTGAVFAAVVVTFELCALLIRRRHPRHPLAWLFAVVGVFLALAFGLEGYAAYAPLGGMPGGTFAGWLAYLLVEPALILLVVYLLLLFPNGRYVSKRWKGAGYLGLLSLTLVTIGAAFEPRELVFSLTGGAFPPPAANPFGLTSAGGVLTLVYEIGDMLAAVVAVLSVVSIFVRYRRADTEQRAQLRWLLYAAVMLFLSLAITPRISIPFPYVNALIFLVGIVAIPIAASIAIIKYRLYDIDLVINKTLVYGLLAAFVSGVYVAVVVGIGSAIGSGDEPNIALSIAATALVAVAFHPAREIAQKVADRLVYGRRATPTELMSDLAPRMAAAISVDDVLPRMAEFTARGVGAELARVPLFLPNGTDLSRSWPPDAASDNFDAEIEVLHSGEKVGDISIRKPAGEKLRGADRKVLAGFASQAGVALSSVRLTEELRAKLDEISAQAEELRRSRQRIVEASDAERRRIERNLHDGAQQRLVALGLELNILESKLPADHPSRAELGKVSEDLRDAMSELRELARGIHPAILTEQGLGPALESLVNRASVDSVVTELPGERLPEQVEAAAYYVVAEALTNVARYAQATQAEVSAAQEGSTLVVRVSDDGIGGATMEKGTGLLGLADRVAALGGDMEIDSPEGHGTRVIVRLPCE